MDTLIVGTGVLSGAFTTYKTAKKLVKDLKKFRNKIHKPRFLRKRITGLVLPTGILNNEIKQQLETIQSLCVIDIDNITDGMAEFERKVMIVKKEIERLKSVYGKHKHYLVVGSDPTLMKLTGTQSRYVGMIDAKLYKSIRNATDVDDSTQLKLVDNIVKIQSETMCVSPKRKFIFSNQEELIETLLFLYSK